MSKNFKKFIEAQPTTHFRVLESGGKIIKRVFNTDNSYIDYDLEEDHELCLLQDDIPH